MLQDLLLLMVPFLFHHPTPTPLHTRIYTHRCVITNLSPTYMRKHGICLSEFGSLHLTPRFPVAFISSQMWRFHFFCMAPWNFITSLKRLPHIISAPYISSATISICYRDHLVQVSYPGKIQRPPHKWSPAHWRVLWQTRCFPALFRRVTRQSLIWGVSGFENWLQLAFSVQSTTVSLIFYFMFKDIHLP